MIKEVRIGIIIIILGWIDANRVFDRNFCIKWAKIVPIARRRIARVNLISHKVVKDVVGFGDGEFLTDLRIALVDCLKNLSLTLVNSLKTLASEHVNRLCRKISLKTKT